MLYLKGLGVATNPEEAFRWLSLAGEQGLADAQFQLGLMREKGVGVRQDYSQAQLWLTLAAERGDSDGTSWPLNRAFPRHKPG
jgi:TPR repeat protein